MSKEKKNPGSRIMTVVGIVLCIILLPILIINCILIVKGLTDSDKVPTVKGVFPMIVLTDSMYPYIHSGDLIICASLDPQDVAVGDVITFYDPAGSGKTTVTHRVTELTEDADGLAFRTKGDANNTEDTELVPAAKLIGRYRFRIAGAGNVAIFMQKTEGLIVCVVIPVLLLVGYDVLQSRKFNRKKQQETEALMAELEALKAEKAKEKQEI